MYLIDHNVRELRQLLQERRIAAACTVPTLLGYYKSEYGVSYGYGSAMLASGAIVLASVPSGVAMAHAACIALYGLRLSLFLLCRELTIPRFREFREKIESRAVERGSRLARTPFIASCSALYLGLASPMMLTMDRAVLGRERVVDVRQARVARVEEPQHLLVGVVRVRPDLVVLDEVVECNVTRFRLSLR